MALDVLRLLILLAGCWPTLVLTTVNVNAEKRSSIILSYAALGDSYAAGDGVGSSKLLPNFDSLCGRFSDAYPIQVANASVLHIDPFHFANLACGGATSQSVLKFQVPKIEDSDVVSIQVGGNEVDFFLVLNECIQQWKPFSTCDQELDKARKLVQSTRFIENFDRMVAGAAGQLKHKAQLFILGYARFFNADTEQCNHATFSKTDPTNFLTHELRRKFNDLVVLLNRVIEASATAHGSSFVDVDLLFEGHRFCEEGVIEPQPDRDDTWFFRESPNPRLLFEKDWPIQTPPAQGQQVISNPFRDFLDLTKTFHPTTRGHVAIAHELVSRILAARR